MRFFLFLTSFAILPLLFIAAPAQTPEDLDKLVQRLIELDSIDLTPGLKFRPGLEPSLEALDADESAMKAMKNPYEVFGQNKPLAAGWYRVSFTVPEKLGKFAIPKNGYNLGIETNLIGSYESYTYLNGKHAGLWSKEGLKRATDQPPTEWMSNAPMPTKAGDRITLAILAMASPLGRGSPEGFGLRHLRLRYALAHTGARQPFYGSVSRPGLGTGLHGAREMLRATTGAEREALQAKLKEPLARLDAVFEAAETGVLDNLTKAMANASKEINEALKK